MLTPTSKIISLLGWGPTGDLGPLTIYTSKRRKIVAFLKAPPTCPPSAWQSHQRNAFRLVARAWNGLTDAQRDQWRLAEVRAPLNITAYNLFTYWCLTHDHAMIRTIQRQTDTNLVT